MNIGDQQEDQQTPVTVLLVDDYEPFRDWVSSFFLKQPGFQIIAIAADGQEGFRLTAELRPDLVLLDIALPKLNGIEVTRRIRAASLDSKIVFLTGNDFPQVAREAFEVGANAYVIKSNAASELLTAVKVAFQGGRYVSAKLRNCGFTDL